MTFIKFIVSVELFGILLVGSGFSQEGAKSPILNFEEDIIQGEKRMPNILVQINSQEMSMDSVLYLRKDFNDFVQQESFVSPNFLINGHTRKSGASPK